MLDDILEIPGLSGKWTEVSARYDYSGDKCKCPVCSKLGFPWGGWFSCESQEHVSLVADGRTFVKVPE